MDWIAPVIAIITIVGTSIAAPLIAARGNRAVARSSREPTVSAAWAEADRARSRMHVVEDAFYMIRGVFKNLARRVTGLFPEFELTDDERDALKYELPPEEAPEQTTSKEQA